MPADMPENFHVIGTQPDATDGDGGRSYDAAAAHQQQRATARTSAEAYEAACDAYNAAAEAYRAADKHLREAQDAAEAADDEVRRAGMYLRHHEIYPGLPLYRHNSRCLSKRADGHAGCRPEWHFDQQEESK